MGSTRNWREYSKDACTRSGAKSHKVVGTILGSNLGEGFASANPIGALRSPQGQAYITRVRKPAKNSELRLETSQ